MAMNPTVLGDALKSAVDGLDAPIDRTEMFRAMAQVIITHIVSNAVVTTVTPGATAGPTALPGTGTIA